MSLQEHVTGTAKRVDKLTFDSKNRSSSAFGCGVCLWMFESKSELEIHNYLEHIIINHSEHEIS
jgi:hypothetical protein